MAEARPHLYSIGPEELACLLAEAGCDIGDARRLLAHVVSQGGDLDTARRVPRRLRQAARERTLAGDLAMVERAVDPADGFVKYLLRSPDGALSEAVRIPLHHPHRYSVCLSSQVGCAMECAFCATGRLGFSRNLAAWEMVAAFRLLAREARAEGGRVSGAVFMGQGEPLANYDEVIAAARVLCHPCGGRIKASAITISTVGLVPQIRRYTRERHPYRLVVSLTSAVAERRRRLLPIAGRAELNELAAALREHAAARGQRLSVAWVLLAGINSGDDEVRALRELLGGVPLRLNLIDVNDARPDGFARASTAERRRFVDALQALEAPVVRRYSGGAALHAACGMLANVRS